MPRAPLFDSASYAYLLFSPSVSSSSSSSSLFHLCLLCSFVTLSDVRLGTFPRYRLVVDKGFNKPPIQTKAAESSLSKKDYLRQSLSHEARFIRRQITLGKINEIPNKPLFFLLLFPSNTIVTIIVVITTLPPTTIIINTTITILKVSPSERV